MRQKASPSPSAAAAAAAAATPYCYTPFLLYKHETQFTLYAPLSVSLPLHLRALRVVAVVVVVVVVVALHRHSIEYIIQSSSSSSSSSCCLILNWVIYSILLLNRKTNRPIHDRQFPNKMNPVSQ